MTYNKDVTRLVKLGQQCMDRVASIAVDQAGTSICKPFQAKKKKKNSL